MSGALVYDRRWRYHLSMRFRRLVRRLGLWGPWTKPYTHTAHRTRTPMARLSASCRPACRVDGYTRAAMIPPSNVTLSCCPYGVITPDADPHSRLDYPSPVTRHPSPVTTSTQTTYWVYMGTYRPERGILRRVVRNRPWDSVVNLLTLYSLSGWLLKLFYILNCSGVSGCFFEDWSVYKPSLSSIFIRSSSISALFLLFFSESLSRLSMACSDK